jgi:hypothetical protein
MRKLSYDSYDHIKLSLSVLRASLNNLNSSTVLNITDNLLLRSL